MSDAKIDAAVIELATHRYRQQLDSAAETLAAYDAEVTPIRDRFTPRLRRHAAEIQRAHDLLLGHLRQAPVTLWGKVKTRVVHGIKVGWVKSKDAWPWPADDALVALIRERCTPEQQETYLQTTTVGRKAAIPEEVRTQTLGLQCRPGTDTPVITEITTGTGAALLDLLSKTPDPQEAP